MIYKTGWSRRVTEHFKKASEDLGCSQYKPKLPGPMEMLTTLTGPLHFPYMYWSVILWPTNMTGLQKDQRKCIWNTTHKVQNTGTTSSYLLIPFLYKLFKDILIYSKKGVPQRVVCVYRGLSHLGCLRVTQGQFRSRLHHFSSRSPLVHTGNSKWCFKYWSACHLSRRPGWNSWGTSVNPWMEDPLTITLPLK